MARTIRLSEAAFACYSKVCAPPPAGRGGSSNANARATYLKGKRRGKSSRKVGITQPSPSLAQRKFDRANDDAAEARQAFMTKLRSRTH